MICRSNGARYEITAAIRADEIEFRLDAFAAKGAFKSADHRLLKIDGQISVAAFAIRFYFQHSFYFPSFG